MKTIYTHPIVIYYILKRPWYVILFLGSMLGIGMVLIWFFNLELIIYMFSGSSLSTAGALLFFFETLASIYGEIFTSLRNILFVLFSILFALNITVLVFIKRHHSSSPRLGKSNVAVAFFGSGCVACGGSVLAPLLTLTGATATAGLSQTINIVAFTAAVILAALSLRTLLKNNIHYISM